MREKLKSYVELLFAGTTGTEEMRQEILQNTLDRYDDLIAQGKTPEEAYRQAVAGIGDIEALLGNQEPCASFTQEPQTAYVSMGKRICDAVAVALYILSPIPLFLLENELGLCCLLGMVACGVAIQVMAGKMMDTLDERDPLSTGTRSVINAVAIALYILCPVPLFLFQNELGLCCLLGMVAIGVAMQIVAKKGQREGPMRRQESVKKQEDPVRKQIASLVWSIGTIVYLLVSFSTGAWSISWIIFPITGVVNQLISAITDAVSGESNGKSISKTIVQAVILLVLCGILAAGIFSTRLWVPLAIGNITEESGSTQAESGSFDADSVQELSIDWTAGLVELQSGSGEKIRYTVSGNTGIPTVSRLSGGKLSISYSASVNTLFGVSKRKNLTVTIPKGWIGEKIYITSVSAPVQLDGMDAKELDIETVSGGIQAVNLNLETADLQTISGEIGFSGTARNLKTETVSGTCTARITGTPQSIQMDSVSGNLNVTLSEAAGFQLNWDTVSGKIQADQALTMEKEGRYRSGNGECQIRVETVSGNLRLLAE